MLRVPLEDALTALHLTDQHVDPPAPAPWRKRWIEVLRLAEQTCRGSGIIHRGCQRDNLVSNRDALKLQADLVNRERCRLLIDTHHSPQGRRTLRNQYSLVDLDRVCERGPDHIADSCRRRIEARIEIQLKHGAGRKLDTPGYDSICAAGSSAFIDGKSDRRFRAIVPAAAEPRAIEILVSVCGRHGQSRRSREKHVDTINVLA